MIKKKLSTKKNIKEVDAMKAALLFMTKDQEGSHLPSDRRFFSEAEKGIAHVLKNISGFADDELKMILFYNKPQ